MRVIVVGGRGFIGQRIVRGLARVDGLEVRVASRGGPLRVDLDDAASFEAIRAGDFVVDASASSRTRPDALVEACLARGATLLVTSSDRALIERLLVAYRRGKPAHAGPGCVVLGAGIFTGVSNVLAGAVAARCRAEGAAVDHVELAVASSPFSGAGAGTIDLMVDTLAIPARRVEGGAWVDRPSVSAGPVVAFPDAERATLEVPLAEPAMIAESTGAPSARMFFAPKPGLLRASFLLLPASLLRRGWFRGALRLYFTLLRRVLLSRVPSSVEIVATARAGGRSARASVTVSDGMAALGVAVAATIELLRERQPPAPGVHLIDELVALAPLRERMETLCPPELTMRWEEDRSQAR